MNKAGKIAYSWLKAQSDSEKVRFIAQALGSVEYQAFKKKISLKSSMPTIYL